MGINNNMNNNSNNNNNNSNEEINNLDELRLAEGEQLNYLINKGFNNKDIKIFNNTIFEVKNPAIEERIARLVIVLNNIEKELSKIETTLENLIQVGFMKGNESIVDLACEKLSKVQSLTLKIQQARLNLSYYFI